MVKYVKEFDCIVPALLFSGELIKEKNCDKLWQKDWVQFGDHHSKKFSQGWKLHVSATEEGALSVAKVVLPILTQLNVVYKIAPDLDYLKMLEGRKTQKGKLITIYPPSLEETREIAIKLDKALAEAIKSGDLKKTDFVRLSGDARLGTSGGLFARYGELYQTKVNLKIIDYQLKVKDPNGVEDDRTVPWPDFMNNRNYWPLEKPFGSLEMTWEGKKEWALKNPITWENRPKTWKQFD